MVAVGPAPSYTVRQLQVHARIRHAPEQEPVRVARRVTIATPKGWTPEPAPAPGQLHLFEPEGEGRMTLAVCVHPSQLKEILDELRRSHPGSTPNPPQPLELAQLNTVMGDRATRYAITGRQRGEMVLVERMETIVFVSVVVRASAWERVSSLMPEVYRSIRIERVRDEADQAPRHRPHHRWE